MTPVEFQKLIGEFGAISALSNMATYFEKFADQCEDWEKEHFIGEAERVLNAVKKLPLA